MNIIKTKNLTEVQFQRINKLWNEEYPMNLNDRFGSLLEGVQHFNHYLVEKDKNIIAWAVDFEKDAEIRFSIIVDSNYHGQGLGSLLVQQLKTDLDEFYGWVIDHDNDKKQNGEFYKSPLAFYVNQGFEVLAWERIDSDILSAVKIKMNRRR